MKKLLSKFLLVGVICAMGATTANAADLMMGENVLMQEQSTGDAYLLGGNVNVKSDVLGDLYVAGGEVTINGNILSDAVIAGGKVNIVGEVKGDLRVIGGQVAVYGNVGEDIIITGGQVDIGKNAVVAGDIYTSSGMLTIDGKVNGNLKGLLGALLVNGSVGKDVVIKVQDKMSFANTANVGGNLSYSSMITSEVPAGVVKGSVNFNKFEKENAKEGLVYFFLAERIWSLSGAILIALIFCLLAPNFMRRAPVLARENVLKAFGIGLLSMIVGLIGTMILFTTIIGIPLALIAAAGLFIAFYISKIFAAAFIGSYLFKFTKTTSRAKLFGAITLSLVVYYLIGFIPVAGWIINFVLFLIGLGTIFMLKMEIFQQLRAKKLV